MLAALLVVMVVVGLGSGYFIGNGSRGTSATGSTVSLIESSTITSTQTTTVTSILLSGTTTVASGGPVPVTEVETSNVSVGGFTVAVNPGAGRIYVAGTSDILTVIDALSHTVVARVTLPNSSNAGIAIDYRTGMVYVLVQGGIAVINGTSNSLIRELPADFGFRSIAFDAATDTIYGSPETAVLAGHAGNLIGVNAQTGAVTANISIGYWANDIEVNPQLNMIYAVGCDRQGLACDSVVSIVNGTSDRLLGEMHLGSPYYATATINEITGSVYVSGENQLVAFNSLGNVTYNSYPDTCGPFISMASDSSRDQVILAPQNYNYLLVYDGRFGNLLNMYSLPSAPQYVAFDPGTNETYVLLSDSLLSLRAVNGTGHVNTALIGADQFCNPP